LGHDLMAPDETRRLEALKRITHPPAAMHFPLLLELLRKEKNPKILKAIGPALAFADPAQILKSLAWVRKETDPLKKSAVFDLLRSVSDRPACDFLIEWFAESPPTTDAERATFASAFRRFRAFAIPQFKDLLSKNIVPKTRMEILKQLGMIGDKSAGPVLLKAIPAYTRDAVVGLIKLGKPAFPTLLEGSRSTDAETRRVCGFLCRKMASGPLEVWWTANRKAVQAEEQAWWKDQEQKGYPVDPAAFAPYEMPLESFVY
jgi:hypothetical protein